MCSICGCPSYVPCNCTADPCSTTGCPIKLDSNCVIYHKDLNILSGLVNLNLNNGSTLQLILEAIDTKLGNLTVADWNLACLRADYTINSIRQFAEAVDEKICALAEGNYLGNTDGVLNDTEPGQYWFRTDLTALHINLNGSIYSITITPV